jgi:hypothetical protein
VETSISPLVRGGDRPYEPERAPIPRRLVLDRDLVTGLDDGFAEPTLRERVGRAGRHHPLRCRAIRILDRKMHRPVGIRERQL